MGFKAKRQRYQDAQNNAKVPTFFIPLLVVFVLSSVAMYMFYLASKLIGG